MDVYQAFFATVTIAFGKFYTVVNRLIEHNCVLESELWKLPGWFESFYIDGRHFNNTVNYLILMLRR